MEAPGPLDPKETREPVGTPERLAYKALLEPLELQDFLDLKDLPDRLETPEGQGRLAAQVLLDQLVPPDLPDPRDFLEQLVLLANRV